MQIRGPRRKTALLLAVGAVAVGLGVAAYATHLLRRSELQSVDARYSIRHRHVRPRELIVVGIDLATLHEAPRFGQRQAFPLPRRDDARVIDALRRDGARAIALDLEFSTPTDLADDNALIEALARARGKTVLATTNVEAGGRTQLLGGEGLLREIGARAAEVRVVQDPDGVVRRFAHSYRGLHSFGVAAVEAATSHAVERSRFGGDGTAPIDFDGPPETVRFVSFLDVLRGSFPRDLFRSKIVIVGATASILKDYNSTATSGSSVMPNVEMWANAVDTLVRGVPLREAPGWIDVTLIVLLGLAVPLSGLRAGRWRSLLEALALAALFSVAVQLTFNSGWIVSYVYPLLALALGTLASLSVLYVTEAIERERVRDLFARFVPGGVVDEVLAMTGENLRLGGVERDCTVLFSDLRGFTSFSETQPAARVIEVVNCYLNEMTEAILEAGGTLISYMGDGIMAIFGAPLEQEDHADRALAAAREMVGPRLERVNAWLAEQGFEHSFAMGVGLNSGTVMAGNVGSEQRVEYTAIGDTTNTASRLEGLTKNSGTMLLISDSTRRRMRTPVEELAPFGEVEIRGRVEQLAVWTIWPSGVAVEGGAGAAAGVAAEASAGRSGADRGSGEPHADEGVA
ncbi:MAG: adenylate/guanylate cyclase domain-containing protein [Actinobacteria bacterium]|nr:MAG: adenylate/guanylate cyclase domain-containing protein [Actinomycetota bacterium]